jgi:hypothetical protein
MMRKIIIMVSILIIGNVNSKANNVNGINWTAKYPFGNLVLSSKANVDEITSLSRITCLLGITSIQKDESEGSDVKYEIKAFPKRINDELRNLSGVRFSYNTDDNNITFKFEDEDGIMTLQKKGDEIVYLGKGITLFGF